jgi:hypothetical protein
LENRKTKKPACELAFLQDELQLLGSAFLLFFSSRSGRGFSSRGFGGRGFSSRGFGGRGFSSRSSSGGFNSRGFRLAASGNGQCEQSSNEERVFHFDSF